MSPSLEKTIEHGLNLLFGLAVGFVAIKYAKDVPGLYETLIGVASSLITLPFKNPIAAAVSRRPSAPDPSEE